MLEMDQILRANELSLSLVAAIPALTVTWGLLAALYQWVDLLFAVLLCTACAGLYYPAVPVWFLPLSFQLVTECAQVQVAPHGLHASVTSTGASVLCHCSQLALPLTYPPCPLFLVLVPWYMSQVAGPAGA